MERRWESALLGKMPDTCVERVGSEPAIVP